MCPHKITVAGYNILSVNGLWTQVSVVGLTQVTWNHCSWHCVLLCAYLILYHTHFHSPLCRVCILFSPTANHENRHEIQSRIGPAHSSLRQFNWEDLQHLQWSGPYIRVILLIHPFISSINLLSKDQFFVFKCCVCLRLLQVKIQKTFHHKLFALSYFHPFISFINLLSKDQCFFVL